MYNRIPRPEVSGGFLLWIAWLNYLDRGNLVPLALLACLLHELGHLACLARFGARVRRIRITAAGAQIQLDRALDYRREAAAAAAGPAVNLLLALLFARWALGWTFSGLNLSLACLNLLPIGDLDGGRILRCTLSLLWGPDAARHVCFAVETVALLLLSLCSIALAYTVKNLTLLMAVLWFLLIFSAGKNRFALVLGERKR